MRIVCVLAFSAVGLFAQLAPPNEAGVTLGHLHYMVSDPDATKKAWVDVFGATPDKAGSLEMLKLPGIFVIVGKSAMPPAAAPSTVHHVGIEVKDYPATKAKAAAAGLMWRELTANVQAFLSMPEGVTVEVMENKMLATPVAFHHVHESVVDGDAARAWYMKEFGAASGSRRSLPAAMIPGGEIDFLKAQMPPEGSKGHALDHIGFDVKDLDAFMKKMAADGVTVNMPSTDMKARIGLKIAFITDPNGTYIEITEGLASK